MNPARRCAFAVVRRVFEGGAYADRAFFSEAHELAPRDRALAQAIAYGTVQRAGTLDHLIAKLAERPARQLEPAVRASLELGLFQLLYLDGVPAHAAVDESVELVKRLSPGGARLVNAILRRAAREGPDMLAGLHDRDPQAAALMHSVPEWLAEMWFAELGAEEARELMGRVNQPAESALRVNFLLGRTEQVLRRLPPHSRPVDGLPEAIVLEAPFDAFGSALWRDGLIMPQSRASMLVARVVGPQPGDRLLDLCAAPGGKTTHLAALLGDQGRVVAVERHPGRAEELDQTCRRMRVHSVQVVAADAREWAAGEQFDRALVDPPCSGLGTLQSRPDLRWRIQPESIPELARVQRAILANAAESIRGGGTLTYSVCTISRREGRDVVDRFLAEHPGFALDDLGKSYPQWRAPGQAATLQLLPHRDRTDGFFIARLRRRRD